MRNTCYKARRARNIRLFKIRNKEIIEVKKCGDEEIVIISIPQPDTRGVRKLLEKKLEEYKAREERQKEKEIFLRLPTIFKLRLSERLLEEGEVDVDRFTTEMRGEFSDAFTSVGEFLYRSTDALEQAINVINCYVLHNGLHTFKN